MNRECIINYMFLIPGGGMYFIKVFFIPQYGITGAALSTAIALLLFNFSKFLFLKWKMDLSPFTNDYLKLVFILIVSCIITMIIPFLFNIWVDMILRSALFMLLVIPATFYLNLSPEFNEIIKKSWAMVTRK